jgi:hypothetical protein
MSESSSTSGPGGPDRERIEAAEYIAELTVTLAKMAREHQFGALGLILEMAHLEAAGIVAAGSADSE